MYPMFFSTITICPVTTFSVVEKIGSSFTPYTGSDIYVDGVGSSQNLVIDTSQTKMLILYLMAASENSTANAYLPLFITVSNFAPIFEEGPPEQQLVQFDTTGNYTYQIPAALDVEGDAITIILSGLEKWMVHDEVEQTILFDELDETKVGLYSVMLTLMDAKGEYNEYELEF